MRGIWELPAFISADSSVGAVHNPFDPFFAIKILHSSALVGVILPQRMKNIVPPSGENVGLPSCAAEFIGAPIEAGSENETPLKELAQRSYPPSDPLRMV